MSHPSEHLGSLWWPLHFSFPFTFPGPDMCLAWYRIRGPLAEWSCRASCPRKWQAALPQTQDRALCLLLGSCNPKLPDPSWTYLGNWEGAELGIATWSCLPASHPWSTASSKFKSQLYTQRTGEPSWPLLLVQVACGCLPRQLPLIEWVFPAVHYSAQDASVLYRAGHSGEMRRLGNCARRAEAASL